MKVDDGRTGVVFVSRDPSGCYVELQASGGVRLTPEGARRLAAAILLEAGKADCAPVRRSA
jgi:hypothetical protein